MFVVFPGCRLLIRFRWHILGIVSLRRSAFDLELGASTV